MIKLLSLCLLVTSTAFGTTIATVSGFGQWTFFPGTPGDNGGYNLTFFGVDSAGNTFRVDDGSSFARFFATTTMTAPGTYTDSVTTGGPGDVSAHAIVNGVLLSVPQFSYTLGNGGGTFHGGGLDIDLASFVISNYTVTAPFTASGTLAITGAPEVSTGAMITCGILALLGMHQFGRGKTCA